MLLRCSFSIFVIFTTVPLLVASRHCEGKVNLGSIPNPSNLDPVMLSQHDNPMLENQILKPRNRCCPYDFDSQLCRTVHDRILCGYDRNIGEPNGNGGSAPIELERGCRLRNGRVECGYHSGYYTNIRRPPAWDTGVLHGGVVIQSEENPTEWTTDDGNQKQNIEKLKLHRSAFTKQHKLVTRCIEIRERIVCKDM